MLLYEISKYERSARRFEHCGNVVVLNLHIIGIKKTKVYACLVIGVTHFVI